VSDTGQVTDDPVSRQRRTWRPWTICVAAAAAFLASVLFIAFDGFVGVMGSWDTPVPGLWWVRVGIIGHCVLAAAALVLLVLGVNPARRRAAVIGAWMIIPVGFGWFVLTGRMVGKA